MIEKKAPETPSACAKRRHQQELEDVTLKTDVLKMPTLPDEPKRFSGQEME